MCVRPALLPKIFRSRNQRNVVLIRTSYPGQDERVVVAPPHIVRHVVRFKSPPPFIEVVGITDDDVVGSVTVEDVEQWIACQRMIHPDWRDDNRT